MTPLFLAQEAATARQLALLSSVDTVAKSGREP